MRFQRESERDSIRVETRMTHTPMPDGTVTELLEESVDAGATWRTLFEGTYVP